MRIVSKSPVYLYGMRLVDEPGAPDLAFLSLYEFLRYWRVELAAYPRSEWDLPAAASDEYQATLTPSGIQKVREADRKKARAAEDGRRVSRTAASSRSRLRGERRRKGCVGTFP